MKPPPPDSVFGRAFRSAIRSAVTMPAALTHSVFGSPPTNERGQPLDHQLHVMLRFLDAANRPEMSDLEPAEVRRVHERANGLFDVKPVEIASVESHELPTDEAPIPIRVYRPKKTSTPTCVFYHGGGFVFGTLDAYDAVCRSLAKRSECTVVSVDYRLAPEHPFPAAVVDALAAYRWVRLHGDALGLDTDEIAVCGDSAGGNLATVVAQQTLSSDVKPPEFQLLIYPRVDSADVRPSLSEFAEGFYLTRATIEWCRRLYESQNPDPKDPRLSPLRFDGISEIAPTCVVTAGFDPLRDEGEAYVAVLDEANVPMRHLDYPSLVHGFFNLGGVIDAADQALTDIASELRHGLRVGL